MMRATITAFTALALMSVVVVGCRIEVPVAEDVRSVNREHLVSIRRGMSRSEVLALMGTTTVQTYKERFIPDTRRWEARIARQAHHESPQDRNRGAARWHCCGDHLLLHRL